MQASEVSTEERVTGPEIVAEISANHRGSIGLALELIGAIADTGATHVKFQTYTPETMTIDSEAERFRISPAHPLWGGRSLYSLYAEAQTPWEWHHALFEKSRSVGLIPFSSPFDVAAVDFLESLSPALYKLASLEIGDLALVRRIAETGAPMVISTGASSLKEIDDALETARDAGCRDMTLLLCTSAYPTQPRDLHLARLRTLREQFGLPVGLSDHSVGIEGSLAAVALGAVMIERHVTMDRSTGGPDAAFSLEPPELARLVDGANHVVQAIGEARWGVIDAESESRGLKRSLYIVRDCEAGTRLSKEDVKSIRPAGGLAPKWLPEVIGKRVRCFVAKGTPLTQDLLEDFQL